MENYRDNLMFGKEEEKFYKWFRNVREPLISPVVEFLVMAGVRPETMSYLGLAMMVPFVYFFSFHPWIAFLFLLLQIFFDGLDGSLARRLKKETAQGSFLDISVDYASFFIVFFTILSYGLMDGFWSAGFVLNYAIMQAFVFFGRIKNIQLFPLVRPKLIFYLILLVWLFTAQNYFDPFLVVATIYLLISNLFLFWRIKCSL